MDFFTIKRFIFISVNCSLSSDPNQWPCSYLNQPDGHYTCDSEWFRDTMKCYVTCSTECKSKSDIKTEKVSEKT